MSNPRISHRVSEYVGDRLTTSTQRLHGRVRVIDSIRVATVGSDIDRAIGASDAGGHVACGTGLCAGQHAGDGLGFTIANRIWIGIVGQYITVGLVPAVPLLTPPASTAVAVSLQQ